MKRSSSPLPPDSPYDRSNVHSDSFTADSPDFNPSDLLHSATPSKNRPSPHSSPAGRLKSGIPRWSPFSLLFCFIIGVIGGVYIETSKSLTAGRMTYGPGSKLTAGIDPALTQALLRSRTLKGEDQDLPKGTAGMIARQICSEFPLISSARLDQGSVNASSEAALAKEVRDSHMLLGREGNGAEGGEGQTVANPSISAIPPLLIIVTPTYVRPFQAMYLHRLANTLSLLPPPLLWVVVEIQQQSPETAAILRDTGMPYRHIVTHKNMSDIKDRGVHQRNAAIEHLEQHQMDGIVYFADDDNIYSQELFREVRKIRRFGVWPVGMLQQGKSRAIIEGPVCNGTRVIGWHTNEKSKRVRRFHVDMCGFAFNSTILWDPLRWRRPTDAPIRQLDSVKEGFQETTFIEQLVADESQMEGLADGCSKVLVYHVHLEGNRKSTFPRRSKPELLKPIVPLRTSARL